MRAFIKNRYSFNTITNKEVLDYEIKQSIYDTTSTIYLETPKEYITEGDFLYIEDNGFLGIIKTVNTEENKTEVICNQPITLFNRDIFFDEAQITYAEDYLADLINEYYINSDDSVYQMQYIVVSASTHTPTTVLPDVEDNLFSVKSYASKIRRLYNIQCHFTLDTNHLYIDIRQGNISTKNIDFSNPGYKIISQDFNSETVGKITTYCTETTKQQNWYLWDDGTVTSDSETAGPLWALQHQTLTFENISASNWVSDLTTYPDYPYKCELILRGVTSNMTADVQVPLNVETVCPKNQTAANKVIIWANANSTVQIEQIVCTPT